MTALDPGDFAYDDEQRHFAGSDQGQGTDPEPAPLPSPEEQAVIDRFEAAPDLSESLRYRVKIAVHDVICNCGGTDTGIWLNGDLTDRAADAAIAVMRGES